MTCVHHKIGRKVGFMLEGKRRFKKQRLVCNVLNTIFNRFRKEADLSHRV